MKYLAGCFISAVLGTVLTLGWLNSEDRQFAHAQSQPQRREGPQFFGNRAATANNRRSQLLFNSDGMTNEEKINVSIYNKVNKGVVNITTKAEESFFLLEGTVEGSGSGCVLDKKGHILTNFHVVEDARKVSVTLYNGKTYAASPVGADPSNDLVVIKIDAPPEVLFPVEFGHSKTLKVGMRVYAIGNPFGLERSMTTGIVASLNRSLRAKNNRMIKSIIQIDAAINPGNSGGPLLDSHGRLIGLNTAIATRTGQSAGIGFAIPESLASRVVPQLIRHGKVIRPEIGISRVYEIQRGLLIAKLKPNGPADKAGLRGPKVTRSRRGVFVVEEIDRSAADLIIAVDGRKTTSADEFLDYIESKKIGDSVVLTILREGKQQRVTVTLGGK